MRVQDTAMAAAAAGDDAPSEPEVIIVGAGLSGLAASACLSLRGVRSLVLERDDCVGSLWRKRAYDRLTLQLHKRVSALPHAPHPAAAPAYLSRDDFAGYLDGYAARFAVRARLGRDVHAARFDAGKGRWVVEAVDLATGEAERYAARYLVAATGPYDEKVVPEVAGLEGFPGKVMHASEYRSARGLGLEGRPVLVVGCGNSGMEIALDLADAGARTSIVVRSELHLVTKEIFNLGISLTKYLPIWIIDKLVLFMCYLVLGDTSRHGLRRPAMGPFARKQHCSAVPVIDAGTYSKIKTGEIQVRPAMTSVHGNTVEFADGTRHPFDAIVFATGYRSGIKRWLQDDGGMIGDDGRTRQGRVKGENGLYFVGLSGNTIQGSGAEAEIVADDISKQLRRGDAGHSRSNGIHLGPELYVNGSGASIDA
ncbi:hypothetical protein ACP70R_030001 [Stipagrostis hirtigluma subsp. patula]